MFDIAVLGTQRGNKMNFQSSPIFPPLRVVLLNPLTPAAQLIVVKIMSGTVFGGNQLIDLTLLVYSNEKPAAEGFKQELMNCAFSSMNSIRVSSDLPSISDADVFCFITSLSNPNNLNIYDIDNDQFDALYLIIKIAHSISTPEPFPGEPEERRKKENLKVKNKPRKPILMADGIIAMEILISLSQNISSDVLFCPTPLPAIAKGALGEHLKVHCNVINDVLVWGAGDECFHVEVEKPMIVHDKVGEETQCDWEMIGKDILEKLNLDYTQFNESWMKKDFIEKVQSAASKNPYGCIYRASEFARTLQTIWKARSTGETNSYASMGVISDGSLGTTKGRAYILPLVFTGDSWSVNKRFEESSHVKQEIKRINRAVKERYEKLNPFCKKFLEENVINQAFIPVDVDSGSVYSLLEHSSRTSVK